MGDFICELLPCSGNALSLGSPEGRVGVTRLNGLALEQKYLYTSQAILNSSLLLRRGGGSRKTCKGANACALQHACVELGINTQDICASSRWYCCALDQSSSETTGHGKGSRFSSPPPPRSSKERSPLNFTSTRVPPRGDIPPRPYAYIPDKIGPKYSQVIKLTQAND